jgi:hypothetical protein
LNRIIESKLVISGDDKTGAMFDSIAKRVDAIGKSGKMAAGVDRMSKSLEKVQSQMAAIDRYANTRGVFEASRKRLQDAAAAVDRHHKTMMTIAAPNRAAGEAEQRRLGRAVDQASKSYETQRAAVFADRRALEQLGVPIKDATLHQERLRAAVLATNAAMDKQKTRQERRAAVADRMARTGAIAGAGMIAAHKVKMLSTSAVVAAAEFDIASRKQREFTDISAEDQANILTPQAKKIGQDTQFTNLDVVKAQTKAMQGLPSNLTGRLKAEVAEGILENVKNYALVMEGDLATSAEAIRSYLQTTNKDISTKEKALKEANKATNQLVKMAKLGGMSDEDVQGFIKFAVASGTAAGLTPESLLSLAALARRGGLRGDEAGVFVRAAASKLVAPTKGGRAALNAAGINYSDYVTMPGNLDVGRLENQFKQDLGIGFTPAVREALQKALSDSSVIGDRGAFTQAVTEAVDPLFGKKKDGSMRASDRQKIARSAGTFHKVSAASVDVEALLDKIMSSDMTLAQLNEFFTAKHGGKGAITQRQRDEYVAARNDLKKVGDDPDFAKRKADEIMAGLGGSFERLKGSVENLTLSIGQAWEGTLKPAFEGLGNAMDWISNLPKPVVAGGALAVGGGMIGGATWLTSKLMGGFGLSASAVALDSSAAALTAAAARIGGGSVIDGAGKAAASAAAGGAVATGSALAGIIAGGAAATWFSWDKFKNNPELAKALTDNPMLGAMAPDAAFAASILHPSSSGGASGVWGDGKISGEATVNSKVEVVVTFDNDKLRSEVKDIVKESTSSMSLMINGPGSVGKSSPDAQPGANGVW